MILDFRRLRLLAVYIVALLPAIAVGTRAALESTATSPLDWVPDSFAPRAEYNAFCERFGNGEVLLVGWDDCTLDNPRLDVLAADLAGNGGPIDGDGQPLISSCVSGRSIAQALTSQTTGTPSADVASRLRGWLVGSDGRSTMLVVQCSMEAANHRKAIVDAVERAIELRCGCPRSELHLAGPIADGLAVELATQQTVQWFAPISAALVLTLAVVCLRSLVAAGLVFGLATLCQGATLAAVHYSGDRLNALSMVLPPLVQALAVSGGIHLVNYYRAAARTHSPQRAAQLTVEQGWLPTALSLGTTAIGLCTLMPSGLSPIRGFGAYASLGVVLVTSALLMVLPACLVWWKPHRGTRHAENAAPPTHRFWNWLARWTRRTHAGVVLGAITLVMVGSWLAMSLRTSVRIETLFPKHSRLLTDYAWLEQRVAPLVTLEAVVRCPDSAGLTDLQQIGLLWGLSTDLAEVPAVGAPVSAATLMVPPQLPSQLPAEQRTALLGQFISAAKSELARLKLVVREEDANLWRISLRASALKEIDYAQTLSSLEQRLHQQTTAIVGANSSVSITMSGVMPLVQQVQELLLSDLAWSFASALLTITMVVQISLGSFSAGLVAMLPNVFPLAVVFGWLGWREVPVDIGTVMTASLGLGIAIDDTLHYLAHFHRFVAAGHSRRSAVAKATCESGTAMVQTSVINGLGVLPMALCGFLPTSLFAFHLALLIGLALLADLVLLPAILVGPLGRLFVTNDATPVDERLREVVSDSTLREAA